MCLVFKFDVVYLIFYFNWVLNGYGVYFLKETFRVLVFGSGSRYRGFCYVNGEVVMGGRVGCRGNGERFGNRNELGGYRFYFSVVNEMFKGFKRKKEKFLDLGNLG